MSIILNGISYTFLLEHITIVFVMLHKYNSH